MANDSFNSSVCRVHGMPFQPWTGLVRPSDVGYPSPALANVTLTGLSPRYCPSCADTGRQRLRIGDVKREQLGAIIYRLAGSAQGREMTVDLGASAPDSRAGRSEAVPVGLPVSRMVQPATASLVAKPIQAARPPTPALPTVPAEDDHRLDDIVLSPSVRKQLARAVTITRKAAILARWGLRHPPKPILLFIGPSGTGKTLTGTAYAREIGRTLHVVCSTGIEGSHVGESQQNLKKLFIKAEETGDVLFFDEAEWLLGKRCSNPSSAADSALNALRDELLKLLETATMPVIFATNLPESVDPAFRRRIGTTVKFEMPDEDARRRIVARELPVAAPLEEGTTHRDVCARIAAGSESLSGGDLREVVKLALVSAVHERDEAGPVHMADFEAALAEVLAARQAVSRKEPVVTVDEVAPGDLRQA